MPRARDRHKRTHTETYSTREKTRHDTTRARERVTHRWRIPSLRRYPLRNSVRSTLCTPLRTTLVSTSQSTTPISPDTTSIRTPIESALTLHRPSYRNGIHGACTRGYHHSHT